MIKDVKRISKKFITIMILILISAVLMAGCSKSQDNAKSPAVKDINEKIKETVDISNMREGDENKLSKLYKINLDDVEEFVLYTAPSNMKSDEIAILKVKDSKNVDSIKEKISQRAAAQAESFKDYAPEEYYLIQKNILKSQGNYILFVVSENVDKIQEVFDGFFK